MLTVLLLLVLAAFVVTLASAWTTGRVPLWVAVLLVVVAQLVTILPVR